jgi:16S rRNA processing protein RimM
MDNNDFFYLGKILKPIGTKGHLLAILDVDDPGRYKKLETVFVGIDLNRIPWTIQSVEIKTGKRITLKFEDIDSFQDALPFQGRELYLPMAMLPQLKGKKFYHHEITGFTVIDKNHGNIGFVKSILEFPQQSLLQVQYGGKEILIPAVDTVIRKIDRKNKVISIEAPEGLVEIYL